MSKIVMLYIALFLLVACGNPNADVIPTVTAQPATPSSTIQPATATPAPTATPATAEATSQPAVTPPTGYTTFEIPFWLALDMPEEWQAIRPPQPGWIALSNRPTDFPYFQLEEGVALVLLIDLGPTNRPPLELLEDDYLASLDPGQEIVTQPHEIMLNGRPAVGASYRSNGDTLEQVVILTDEKQAIAIVAIALEDEVDAFNGIFGQIFQTFRWLPAAPAPAITAGGEPPTDYDLYTLEEQGVTVAYPAGWLTEEPSYGSLALIPEAGSTSDGPSTFVLVESPDAMSYLPKGSIETAEDGIWQRLALLGSTLDAVHLISDISTVGKEPERAAALYYALDEGKPVFGLIGAVRNGDRVVVVVSMLADLEVYQASVEAIISHLQVETPTFIPPNDTEAIVPGQLVEATSSAREPAVFRLAADEQDYLLIVRGTGNGITAYSVNNSAGERIFYESYVTDIASSIRLLRAMPAGDYFIAVGGDSPAGFRLLALPAERGAAGVVEQVMGQLAAGERLVSDYSDLTADWFVFYAEPVAADADSGQLTLELYDDSGQLIAEHHPGPGEATHILYDGRPGRWTLHLYETNGRPVQYQLLVVAAEIGQSDLLPWPATADALPAGDPVRGTEVYQSYSCSACHGNLSDPESTYRGIGPWLGEITTVAGERVPGMTREQYLYESILYADAFIVPDCPVVACPNPSSQPASYASELSEQELADLIAYLLTTEP